MINSSCIYNGQVIHKRFKPKEHFFKYKVFSLLLDLSELHLLEKELKIFSYNKFNSDKSNKSENTLYLKKCSFGLNRL